MIRPRAVLVALLALVGACFETHDPMNQAVGKEDCYTCHVPEYNATGTTAFPTSPAHATSGCNTQCVQCHTTSDWLNGLGGCNHPESAFPLASLNTKHTNIKCIDCHSAALSAIGLSSVGGANTDCIACHANDRSQQQNHIGVTYDTGTLVGQPYAYSTSDHRFCLDCHPKGLAVGHGPMNPFILPHQGSTCAQCHDNASGLGHQNGKDVTCVNGGCHSGIQNHHEDGNPGTGIHVGTISPSCIMSGCHPDGRKHGG